MNNECGGDIQVNPHSLSFTQSLTTSKSSEIVESPKKIFLLLILIQAGIVSPVYVRLVIIVVINDSSILTTGLNTTL